MDESIRIPFTPEAALDLTRAILARTSGSPCQRLQDQACAYVDGELDDSRASLVQAHLAHCPACAALVGALHTSQRLLPTLADADPGPWFTQRLLRATVHRPATSTWWRLMHRPRIALEAAYLGAAAGLLGTYLPMPNLPLKVPAMVQPLGASAQRVVGQVIQVERRASTSLRQSWQPRPAAPASPSLWQRIKARLRRWLPFFRQAAPRPAAVPEKAPPPANP